MALEEINLKDLQFNPFVLLDRDWMLLSAGEKDNYNGMTISWGHFGNLWDDNNKLKGFRCKPTAIAYVRPQRYTKEFMDKEEYFAISYLGKDKKALGYMGSHSGRKGDKFKACGLTPVFKDNTVFPKEAKLVFILRKIYVGKIVEEGFVDKSLVDKNYPMKDFHYVYIGEINKVYLDKEAMEK